MSEKEKIDQEEEDNWYLVTALDAVKYGILIGGAVFMLKCCIGAYQKAPPPERGPSRERYVFEEPHDWADDTTKTLGKVLYLRSVYETKDCTESE